MTDAGEAFPSDALFSTLTAVAVDGIVVIDERGIVKIYNRACERLFGYDSSEVVGFNISMLMPEPLRSEHDSYVARYLDGGAPHIIGMGREVTGRRKDGSTFPMYISVGEGRLDGARIFVGIVHDISARRERERRIEELQRDLRHATRLSTMGQLSSAIAHELNQPLAASLNYINAAYHLTDQMSGEAADRVRAAVERAGIQISRAGDIIRRLREFIEKRELSRAPLDMNATVDEALALGLIGNMRAAIRGRDPAGPRPPPGAGGSRANSAGSDQPDAQRRRRDGRARSAPSPARNPSHRRWRSRRVCCRQRYGDFRRNQTQPVPSPSSPRSQSGIGMGLSICRTIIEAHGGRLWAEAAKDGGTDFQFTLPVANKTPIHRELRTSSSSSSTTTPMCGNR